MTRETSRTAADSIQPDTQRLRRLVFTALRAKGSHGMTCDEVEVICKLRHQTASARIRELFVQSRIKDSGQRRLTRSNRTAIVWVVR